ncbi:PAS domain-containing protein [Aquabacterium humicola]|uniref:PAS domain-containing protein n=1 Tax=Aquabacterium humicola TaxID=3237377 RepID=UPI0025439236|nr:PAS domain-containing protein [Rubrivivax pictus]
MTAERVRWRALPWLGGLFIAAVVAFAAYDIWRDYHATIEATTRELEAQALVIGEQTARSVQAIDVVLRHLARQHRARAFDGLDDAQLHALLREQAVALGQVADGLALHDGRGRTRALSWLHPVPAALASAAERPAFQRIRDDPTTELVIGGTTRGRLDGVSFFPMARRLVGADGRFDGTITARGRVAYFQDFYRDVQVGPTLRIALLHHDGTLLARHPPAPETLGQRIAQAEERLAAYLAGRKPPSRMKSPVDGHDRFGAMRPVPDYPLVVVVSRDADAVLAAWRAQALGSGARTLALAALAAVLLGFATRQLRRLDAARRSLEASRERFALAAAGADDGIWDWDLVAGTAYESARARELQGLPPGPETQPLAELQGSLQVHPDDAERRRATMQAHLDGQSPAYEVDYRVRHPDGAYRWIRVRALCIRDAQGRPQRIAGSVSDIDARQRAEMALRESQERFALAVAGSDDGIWDWNYAAGHAFASARARQILGMPDGPEMQSIDAWFAAMREQLHPDDLAQRDAAIADHLAGRTPAYAGEWRVRQPDGSYRWVRVHGVCIRDTGGQPYRMAGSVSDIDAEQRAKQALKLSEERYAVAMSGSHEAHWVWDIVADQVFVSPYMRELFRLPEGMANPTMRALLDEVPVHADDRARVEQAVADHLAGRSPQIDVEYRLVVRDVAGTAAPRWVHTRASCFRGPDGRAERLAGASVEISARKNAEMARDRLELQLRQAQKLEAIGTLAGGIAHDFNNILSAILGYGEMAQKDAPERSALRRHVDAIVAAGQRAKSLVERILAFSRSGMGERVPVPVQAVVAEALDGVAATLPAGIVLERRLEAGDAAVLGDATQIHQVVLNLCANAVQAMRGGADRPLAGAAGPDTLAVAVERVQLDADLPVATSVLQPGRYLLLTVRDTGAGIPANLLERIFDPFFTTKEVGVGTGLGLSLVHGIVTDLGGGIAVDSVLGEGATFRVYLPWQGAQADAPVPAVDEPVAAGHGETILLVDDEAPLVALGEELLAELGYEPVGFSSSTAALQALRADPDRFQAVLSDEAMPGMTGSELAAEIHRLRPHIPIVLMSGFVNAALSARAREAGVAEVLAKPLVARDIARALAQALNRVTLTEG